MTAFSLPRETSLHRNRDASLLSAIPSLRSLRISFPAPSSKLDIFAKRQVVTCLFCLPVGFSSFPKSSAILFGSIPDDPLFVFLILLYYLLFIFTKKMTAFSLPRETSLHRNRDASLLSAIPSLRSLRISFPTPASQQSGFRKRQSFSDCLFAFLLVSPPSRKVLRFFGSVADDLLFGNIPDKLLFREFFYSINNFCQRHTLFPLSLRFFAAR